MAQSFRKPKVEDEERLAREAERETAYQAARKKKSAAASFVSLYGTKVRPISRRPLATAQHSTVARVASSLMTAHPCCLPIGCCPRGATPPIQILTLHLTSMQGDDRPPVLLVDGYNVLGKLAGYNSDDSDEETDAVLAAAFADGPRLALQNRLCEYSHLRQVKVRWRGDRRSLDLLVYLSRRLFFRCTRGGAANLWRGTSALLTLLTSCTQQGL